MQSRFAVCTKNKYNRSAEEVQAAADAINYELGRFDPKRRHLFEIEVPNHMFTAFLYQSMGIEHSLTHQEIDRVFWDAASPGVPTEGIEDFLAFLKDQNIRTGVISNITYCGEIVNDVLTISHWEQLMKFVSGISEGRPRIMMES